MKRTSKKKLARIAGGAIIIASVVIVVALLPRNDVCSDDVRGYESKASSSLNAARTNFSAIKAAIEVGETLEVPQLEGLNPTSFTALKACDTQCKLLRQCLRFVFLKPPSEACPTEYADYKEANKSALNLLEDLHRLQLATEQAARKADELGRIRKDVEEIEKTSGSTGGRLAVLQAEANHLEGDLSRDLSTISQQVDHLVPQKTGNTQR